MSLLKTTDLVLVIIRLAVYFVGIWDWAQPFNWAQSLGWQATPVYNPLHKLIKFSLIKSQDFCFNCFYRKPVPEPHCSDVRHLLLISSLNLFMTNLLFLCLHCSLVWKVLLCLLGEQSYPWSASLHSAK